MALGARSLASANDSSALPPVAGCRLPIALASTASMLPTSVRIVPAATLPDEPPPKRYSLATMLLAGRSPLPTGIAPCVPSPNRTSPVVRSRTYTRSRVPASKSRESRSTPQNHRLRSLRAAMCRPAPGHCSTGRPGCLVRHCHRALRCEQSVPAWRRPCWYGCCAATAAARIVPVSAEHESDAGRRDFADRVGHHRTGRRCPETYMPRACEGERVIDEQVERTPIGSVPHSHAIRAEAKRADDVPQLTYFGAPADAVTKARSSSTCGKSAAVSKPRYSAESIPAALPNGANDSSADPLATLMSSKANPSNACTDDNRAAIAVIARSVSNTIGAGEPGPQPIPGCVAG